MERGYIMTEYAWTVKEKLDALRVEMKERDIDIYLIPTSDFHESEYVGDYFKVRKYITGFTGSAGTAVVTMQKAGLWTDGRYFIQAESQLSGSGIELYRMGEEGVPGILEFLEETLPAHGTLGFDGRVVNSAAAQKYKEIAQKKEGRLYVTEDLAGNIWKDRPELPKEKVWILEERYSGETAASKLLRVREEMKKAGANVHLLSSLYDIAWLLNLRGDDIRHVPVFLSFILLTEKDTMLFIQEEALTEEVKTYLCGMSVAIRPYEEIYHAAASLPENAVVMMDENIVNYRIRSAMPESVRVVNMDNPSEKMKAVKNETELANTRIAHVKDGVAFTKFMYWLKQNVGKEKITEYTAGKYLDRLRAQQEHFLDLSFDNISAYESNAAMMHYSASEETASELEPKGFLLVDSGGHYLEGTTDITRTIVLGPLSEQQKLHFTTVCRSNLNLANAKFLYGCSGLNLDILSRGPLWQMGIDYKCGTGHGVGHILNVHEGPNGFRWRVVGERKDSGRLEAGMITTDEPGVYLEGQYGIRTENELICIKDEKNEYGQFMRFENITYAPIDLDGIDPEEMTRTERDYLNAYHKVVYEKLSPYLTDEERVWLKTYTREI